MAEEQLCWSVRAVADGSTLVVLKGELDAAYEVVVTELLEGLLGQRAPITIDLGELTFLDSSGLRCLLHAAQVANALGARLTVTNPTGRVRRVMEITAVDRELLTLERPPEKDRRPVAS